MAAIIVHGGAYAIPDAVVDQKIAGCKAAADKAHKALTEGKSALDAVEIAVRSLEDDPVFNAGHGSVFNQAGEVEMDALITDGSTLGCGAVAGVKAISNPISLARMVLERTNHVMLIGEGANKFAEEMGVPKVDPSELATPSARKEWEEYDKYKSVISKVFHSTQKKTKNEDSDHEHDTVGAVAIDLQGNMAAATSTGGISLKKVGRVGDSPLVGSGAYCDNTLGGISCTGHGEAIAKVVLGYRALNQLQSNPKTNLEKALKNSLEFMLNRVGGRGGMIGISRNGEIAKDFSTPRMSWASVDQNGVMKSGI